MTEWLIEYVDPGIPPAIHQSFLAGNLTRDLTTDVVSVQLTNNPAVIAARLSPRSIGGNWKEAEIIYIFSRWGRIVSVKPANDLLPIRLDIDYEVFMRSLWEKKFYTDIEIQVGDRTFSAHRAVLASNSGFFREVLRMTKPGDTIRLQGIEPDVFENLAKLLYGELLYLKPDSMLDLLETVVYYDLNEVYIVSILLAIPSHGSATRIRRLIDLFLLVFPVAAKRPQWIIDHLQTLEAELQILSV